MDQIISFVQGILKSASGWTSLIAAVILTFAIKPLPTNHLISFVFWWSIALVVQKFFIFYQQKVDVYISITSHVKNFRRYFAE